MGEGTVAVHRCRFVDFNPSPISALVFAPLPLPSVKTKKSSVNQPLKFGTLAVGYTNGNIDLCEWTGKEHRSPSPQAWVVRKTISGPFPSKVDTLAFSIRHPDNMNPDDVPAIADLRLFSSGGGNDLVEWDLASGCVKRTIGSQGGSIWSIAVNPASSLLALGCEDGSVRLLSLSFDTLTHHRRFDKVSCRLLSIAWGPPTPRQPKKISHDSDTSSEGEDDDDWYDSWLVTGGSDSSLQKWDVSTGRALDRMKTDKMRGERTLVWAVGVLGDGSIISGDSLGMVKFWDSRTCTQLQSFQGHNADVLCLTIGPDGTTVYTSGIDQKISQFSLVKTTASDPLHTLHPSRRWVLSTSRWMHSHDVRALHTWPPYTPLPPSHRRLFPIDLAPVLASGGFDMSVVLTPAARPSSTTVKVVNPLCTSTESTFELSHHRKLAYSCGPSSTVAVRVARKARLVSCMRETGLSLWRILHRQSLFTEGELADGGWEKVLDMEFNVQTNLVASAISDNGQWLVVSDLHDAKLFMMDDDEKGELRPRRVRNFASILQPHIAKSGGSAFLFSPDSSKLVMASAVSAHLVIIDIGNDLETASVLRRFDHHRSHALVGSRAKKSRRNDGDVEMGIAENDTGSGTPVGINISRLAISSDGQWLASSDDHSRTHIFSLDSLQHHCALPSFPHPVQALSFDPSHPNILIMGFPDNTIQIFDVESRQSPSWSKHFSDPLPTPLKQTHEPILGVTFDPAAAEDPTISPGPSHALFWGSSWMCKLKLDDSPCTSLKKRRRVNKQPLAPDMVEVSSGDQLQNFKMITHFRPILAVDFLAPGELVVVERPLVDVLMNLPPAYFKHKYGVS